MAYKQQKLTSPSPGDGKSEIKVPAWLGSGKGPLPGLHVSHDIFTWQKEGERNFWVSFHKSINPIHKGSTFMI